MLLNHHNFGQTALLLTGMLLPTTTLAAANPQGAPILDTAVVASIGSKYAKPTQNPAALAVDIDTWQVLNSHDDNAEKAPYGVSGPGEVRFAFNEAEKYTAETFRISYYSVGPSPTGAEGAKINPSVWKSATATESPTKIVQCVATATASMTGDIYVAPSPNWSTTKQEVVVKCTGV
ncbi:hypothetical protein IAR50_002637 [Cryptococcus sp. DSM 104548]